MDFKINVINKEEEANKRAVERANIKQKEQEIALRELVNFIKRNVTIEDFDIKSLTDATRQEIILSELASFVLKNISLQYSNIKSLSDTTKNVLLHQGIVMGKYTERSLTNLRLVGNEVTRILKSEKKAQCPRPKLEILPLEERLQCQKASTR